MSPPQFQKDSAAGAGARSERWSRPSALASENGEATLLKFRSREGTMRRLRAAFNTREVI